MIRAFTKVWAFSNVQKQMESPGSISGQHGNQFGKIFEKKKERCSQASRREVPAQSFLERVQIVVIFYFILFIYCTLKEYPSLVSMLGIFSVVLCSFRQCWPAYDALLQRPIASMHMQVFPLNHRIASHESCRKYSSALLAVFISCILGKKFVVALSAWCKTLMTKMYQTTKLSFWQHRWNTQEIYFFSCARLTECHQYRISKRSWRQFPLVFLRQLEREVAADFGCPFEIQFQGCCTVVLCGCRDVSLRVCEFVCTRNEKISGSFKVETHFYFIR